MSDISREKLFKRLIVFHAVAEVGSISEAARKMKVSQPAISYMIHSLEKELGVELFIRRGGAIALLPQGKDLLRRAKGLLKVFDSIKPALEPQRQGYRGEISLATTQSFAEHYLAKHVKLFLRSNPEVHFSVLSGMGSQEIVSATARTDVDFGITSLSRVSPNMHADFLLSTRLVLITPRGWHFSRNTWGELAKLEELDGVDFLIRSQSVTIQRYIDRYLLSQGISPNMVASLSNYTTIKAFVRSGIGCAIVEDFEPTKSEWYEVFPLPYGSSASSYYVLSGKRKYISPQARAFISSLLYAARKIKAVGSHQGEDPIHR